MVESLKHMIFYQMSCLGEIKLNLEYQFLVYTDDGTLFVENIVPWTKKVLLIATKEVCLEESAERTKYVSMSSQQTARRNYKIKVIGSDNAFESQAVSNTVYGNNTNNPNCILKGIRDLFGTEPPLLLFAV